MAINTYDATRLMNDLRVNLPGALDGVIQYELFNAIEDFLKETNLWQEAINFSINPNTNPFQSTIAITPSAGVINRLMFVQDANGFVRQMSMPQPGILKVIDLAGGNETWTATVALSCNDPLPSNGTLAQLPLVPDWLLSKYRQGIKSGVMARMCSQPAKPYSNPKLALVHEAQYLRAVGLGRTDARQQNLYGGQAWLFPQGFATRHQRNRGYG